MNTSDMAQAYKAERDEMERECLEVRALAKRQHEQIEKLERIVSMHQTGRSDLYRALLIVTAALSTVSKGPALLDAEETGRAALAREDALPLAATDKE